MGLQDHAPHTNKTCGNSVMKALQYALALTLITIATLAHAQDSIPVRIHIASASLADAINQWAQQTGYRVVWSEDAGTNALVPEIDGTFPPRQALERLLRNTHLQVEFPDAHTAVISRSAPRAAAGPATPLRLADSTSAVRVADASFDSAAPAEVIVTAQKREERAIDVPISLVALGGDELQQRQLTTFNDLASFIPGLAVWDEGNQRRIMLRGVSNEFGTASAVGLYVDEADVTSQLSSQPEINTYDLERVEVLRGPQGTLYGEGSAGGTIRFITKDPVLSAFGMNADVSASYTQDGAPGQKINMALNVPLITDVLAVRFAGTAAHEGGWIDQPAIDRKNINSQDLVDLRTKILWHPAETFTATAMAELHHNDRGLGDGEDANGNFTTAFGLPTTPNMVEKFGIYNLKLTNDTSWLRVLSTTTYVRQDNDISHFSYGLPASGPPETTPIALVYFPANDTTVRNFNQELRLSSLGTGPWNWTLGGFYRHLRYGSVIPPWLYGPAAKPVSEPFYDLEYRSNSWSAFGELSYRILDRLTLTAGVRDFEDRQTEKPPYTLAWQWGKFHSVDPRFVIEYKLSGNANVYASAAKGFRSGGFNAVGQPPYGPESVWTYELGTKTAWLDNRLRLDTAVFYSDYTNYQIQGFSPPPALPLNIYRNAGSAWIKGLEVSLAWQPLQDWLLSLNGDYLDTRFYKIDAVKSQYIVGDELPLTPKYQVSASVQRDFALYGKSGYVRLDYGQTGNETLRTRNIGPWYFSESDIIDMLNLQTGLHWSDRLSLQLFAHNLLNDRGYINPDKLELHASRAQPRTYGIGFNVTFD
jgi:iron complex outermembrane recepter protein